MATTIVELDELTTPEAATEFSRLEWPLVWPPFWLLLLLVADEPRMILASGVEQWMLDDVGTEFDAKSCEQVASCK